MKIAVRADASVTIGSGHVMRCITLAKALRERGGEIEFWCKELPGNLIPFIQSEGFQVRNYSGDHVNGGLVGYELWLGSSEQHDAETWLQMVENESFDLLIVDHYALRASFESQLRAAAKNIMVIDDLAEHAHDCDILLNQNLLPDLDSRYVPLLPESCLTLLGPHYALLREEFYKAREIGIRPRKELKHLLVFFGAADTTSLTTQAVTAALKINNADLSADVIITNIYPDTSTLQLLCDSHPRFKLHRGTKQMAELLARADLAIGAGGSSHWERCMLGVPAIVVTLSENQVEPTKTLDLHGCCTWLGHVESIEQVDFQRALEDFIEHPKMLEEMSALAAKCVGLEDGTSRVVEVICEQIQL